MNELLLLLKHLLSAFYLWLRSIFHSSIDSFNSLFVLFWSLKSTINWSKLNRLNNNNNNGLQWARVFEQYRITHMNQIWGINEHVHNFVHCSHSKSATESEEWIITSIKFNGWTNTKTLVLASIHNFFLRSLQTKLFI